MANDLTRIIMANLAGSAGAAPSSSARAGGAAGHLSSREENLLCQAIHTPAPSPASPPQAGRAGSREPISLADLAQLMR